jgi:hypothetical protein
LLFEADLDGFAGLVLVELGYSPNPKFLGFACQHILLYHGKQTTLDNQ